MYQPIKQLRRRLNDRNVWDRQRVIFCIIAENSRRQLCKPELAGSDVIEEGLTWLDV